MPLRAPVESITYQPSSSYPAVSPTDSVALKTVRYTVEPLVSLNRTVNVTVAVSMFEMATPRTTCSVDDGGADRIVTAVVPFKSVCCTLPVYVVAVCSAYETTDAGFVVATVPPSRASRVWVVVPRVSIRRLS